MSIRLIDVKTLRMKSFNSRKAPQYAILSHTWVEDEEVSFQEMCQIVEKHSHLAMLKSGYRKILEFCRKSISYGVDYAWVDTCCIDKSSSAELSEAINSMFRWYRDAKVCFAYLSDYSFFDSRNLENLRGCNWFTRGWCLQELIAPKHLIFYDRAWKVLGSRYDLQKLVASITRIDEDVLEDHNVMYSLPVARRMSWASQRETTRIEDIAYCLLGIFDIHMPMLYGEGERAFSRLQEEIIRRLNDTSIFLFSPYASADDPTNTHDDLTGKVSEGASKL
ncbi:Vegetative incompatibility protein HET-E-1 [Colletotrichum siamense]|nr:Vegetative incompatibility protein HET-E-1 [Colletotrichum siamense]KAF4874648.1 Vegetative incompatibility protein HET-E-1 [Colletotrichum siamense]